MDYQPIEIGAHVPVAEPAKPTEPPKISPQGKRGGGQVATLKRQLSSITAKYDAAQTTNDNELHWANSDTLDPNAANSFAVRQKLRARARYEVIENNPYLKGMFLTLASDFVGTGPKLQIKDKRYSAEQKKIIEARFNTWTAACKLRQKFWRMRLAKGVDGESFALIHTNQRLRGPHKLDLWVVEADQITSMGIPVKKNSPREIDGVRFDQFYNPIAYHVLQEHPGSNLVSNYLPASLSGNWVASDYVLHWYRQDRGWLRGIPEITPSLPLCAMLRRYTLAVVQAAEVAANFAGVLETDGPPNITAYGEVGSMTQEEIEDQWFDAFPVMRGMITTLPFNSKLSQLRAEQPSALYDKFVDCLIREISRPLLMPFNIAAGFSGDYNMASGAVDKQIYWNSQTIERMHGEEEILEPLIFHWWREAVRLPGYLSQNIISGDQPIDGQTEVPEHDWRWDNPPDHPDPEKTANSIQTLWDGGHITDDQIQQTRFNRDPEAHYEALAEQQARREALGLPTPGSASASFQEKEDPNQE